MNRWKRWVGAAARKLRGVLGLSLIGGTLTAIGGAAISAVIVVVNFGPGRAGMLTLIEFLGEITPVFFGVGALASAGFASLLAVTSGRSTIAELGWRRVAAIGALTGFLVPIGFVALVGGPSGLVETFLELFPVYSAFGAGGAALSASLVAMGKRAQARELRAVDEVVNALGAGTD